MRVLFVSPFYEPAWIYGGVVRSSRDWAKALLSAGVRVSVLTTTANGNSELPVPIGEPVDCDGVSVTYFPRWRTSGNRFIAPALWRACAAGCAEFDVVHSIGLWTFPAMVSAWAARRRSIPYVVSLHGMLMPWAYQHHGWSKQLGMALSERPRLQQAAQLLCTSDLELRHLDDFRLKVQARVIPNVVDVTQVRPEPERFRQRFNLHDRLVILFVGRLVENKGLHLTLAAFSNLAERFPEASLVVVGPAEDGSAAQVRLQMRTLGLENRVLFTGLLTGQDYWDAVAGADLFVLNSYSENFGLAPAEALGLGVPVLLSDQIGIAESVLEYRAGVVAPLDVASISRSMEMMLSNRAELHAMGQNGRRLVSDRFSPAVVGRNFASLLGDIIQEWHS